MGQVSHEPSMEDILASIKRIIAEDSEAVGARPVRLRREAVAAVQASPLVTGVTDGEGLPEDRAEAATPEVAQQDWKPEDAPAEGNAPTQSGPEDSGADANQAEMARIETDGNAEGEAVPVAAAPIENPARTPEDVLELTSPMSDANRETQENRDTSAAKKGLVSGQAATASRNAFAALTQLQVRNEEGESNTLEGLVGDLLKPMLREWLDRELPTLVERVVTAEVRRLSGGAV